MSEESRYKAALEKAYVLFPKTRIHAGCCRDTLMIEEGQQQVIEHFQKILYENNTKYNFNSTISQSERLARMHSEPLAEYNYRKIT